jgi:hypothetical protein
MVAPRLVGTGRLAGAMGSGMVGGAALGQAVHRRQGL